MAGGYSSLMAFWGGGAANPPASLIGSAANTLTLAPRSTQVGTWPRATLNNLTFHAAASQVGTWPRATLNHITFAASSIAHLIFTKSSANTLTFAASSSEIVSIGRTSENKIVFRARVKNKSAQIAFDDVYRGQYQQGLRTPLFVQAKDSKGRAALPGTQIGSRVYQLGVGLSTTAAGVPFVPHAKAAAVFSGGPVLGQPQAPAQYFVLNTWSNGSFVGMETATFAVIAGGDPRGAIISAHDFRRPESRHILAQVEGGLILDGRDPSDTP